MQGNEVASFFCSWVSSWLISVYWGNGFSPHCIVCPLLSRSHWHGYMSLLLNSCFSLVPRLCWCQPHIPAIAVNLGSALNPEKHLQFHCFHLYGARHRGVHLGFQFQGDRAGGSLGVQGRFFYRKILKCLLGVSFNLYNHLYKIAIRDSFPFSPPPPTLKTCLR